MTEHGDYQLDPFEEHGTIDLAEELAAAKSSRSWLWIGAAAVIGVALIAWAVWKFVGSEPAPVAPPVVAPAPAPPPAEPLEQEEVDLPALAESDLWLKDVIGQLSEHPQLVTWLLNEDLVRRLVATVDNLAEGVSPRPHVRFLQPSGGFSTAESGETLTVSSASFKRYDGLTEVLTSLHVDGTAQVYRNVKPLLDEAYRELGYPDGDFDVVAAQVVRVLLDTPIVPDAEIERFATSYKYADSRLEELSDAQKHFMRFGPDNLVRLQNHVRQIAERAGLEIR